MSYFEPGEKVYFLGFDGTVWFSDERLPEPHQVYTVREVTAIEDGEECIRLVEVINKPREYVRAFTECCFRAKFFEKLPENPATIEWARQICRDVERELAKPRVQEPTP